VTEHVTIGGREFRIGATYRGKIPANARPGFEPAQRRLLAVAQRKGYTDQSNRVCYETPRGRPGFVKAINWARWAGDEVQP
jgi:hypothetical protein